MLCQLGCETPRINYEVYNGHPYRYFYAISSDVDAENPGTVRSYFSIISFEFLEPFISMDTSNDLFLFPLQLIKVDTSKKTCLTWAEPNVYASEPVFIAHPDAKVLLLKNKHIRYLNVYNCINVYKNERIRYLNVYEMFSSKLISISMN